MDMDDFIEAVDSAGRDAEHYVSIDRAKVTHEFLSDLINENGQAFSEMTVRKMVEKLEGLL